MPDVSLVSVQPTTTAASSGASQERWMAQATRALASVEELDKATAAALDKVMSEQGQGLAALIDLHAKTTLLSREAETLSAWLQANRKVLEQLTGKLSS